MATVPLPLAVAVQLVNPPVKAMVGLAGTVKPVAKVTAMVLPAARAPVVEALKPTVQVAVAPAVCGEPVKVTVVGEVGVMVTEGLGLAAAVSSEVDTLKLVYEVPAPGLVTPAMVRVAAVLLVRAQPAPARVMVATAPVATAVAVQLAKPVAQGDGRGGRHGEAVAKVTVMVLPAAARRSRRW